MPSVNHGDASVMFHKETSWQIGQTRSFLLQANTGRESAAILGLGINFIFLHDNDPKYTSALVEK